MTASAEVRDLAKRVARLVRAGKTDEAADELDDHLQRTYHYGYRDGYNEGRREPSPHGGS